MKDLNTSKFHPIRLDSTGFYWPFIAAVLRVHGNVFVYDLFDCRLMNARASSYSFTLLDECQSEIMCTPDALNECFLW